MPKREIGEKARRDRNKSFMKYRQRSVESEKAMTTTKAEACAFRAERITDKLYTSACCVYNASRYLVRLSSEAFMTYIANTIDRVRAGIFTNSFQKLSLGRSCRNYFWFCDSHRNRKTVRI